MGLSWALIPPAGAHPFLNDSWWVRLEPERVLSRVSVSLREIAVAQGLGGSTNWVALESVLAALEKHAAYVTNAVWIRADGVGLPAEVLEFRLVTDAGAAEPPESPMFLDRTYAHYDLEFPRPAATRELTFGQRTLKEFGYAPGIAWDVTYALLIKDDQGRELGAGLVRSDLPYALELTSETPPSSTSPRPAAVAVAPGTNAFDSDPLPASRVRFADYLKLGVEHIVHGYDHLLFLAALALAAATLGDFLKLILTFTLAHSITVTLSALDWVRLPPWFVEPFIAASIVFVAVENLVAPKRVSSPGRLAIAFGFGLVHGLGFAGGLNDALGNTGGSALALAIVAFCLGVELGHLALGLPFWALLQAGRTEWGDRFAQRAMRFGSVLVAAGGSFFLVAALRNYL
jgi:hydrogenase/urease accessory protein HupE